MSQMLGADPDVLEQVAAHFGVAAHRFDVLRNSLNAAVRQSPWRGPGADQFRGQWDSNYQRSLAAAAEALRVAQAQLVHNAQQQRQASGANGGSTLGSVASRVGAWSWTVGVGGLVWSKLQGTEQLMHTAQILTARPGHLLKGWAPLERGINVLHGSPTLQWMSRLDDTHFFKGVGTIGAVASVGFGALHTQANLAAHHYWDAEGSAADAVGEGLKWGATAGSHANPVLYLTGVNVKIWSDVAQAAHQVDWRPSAFPSPFVNNNWRDSYLPAFGDAAKQVFGKLPGYFL